MYSSHIHIKETLNIFMTLFDTYTHIIYIYVYYHTEYFHN